MIHALRRGVRLLAPIGLVTALATGPVAAGESDDVIIFRLTIRGDEVPATDSFTLAVNDEGKNGVIISPGVLCGPGSENYNPEFVPCEIRSYDWEVGGDSFEVGNPFSYTFGRNDGTLYSGTVTLRDFPQVITVVYDYNRGSLAPAGSLPDTALAPSRAAATIAALGLAATGVVALLCWAWSMRRRRA